MCKIVDKSFSERLKSAAGWRNRARFCATRNPIVRLIAQPPNAFRRQLQKLATGRVRPTGDFRDSITQGFFSLHRPGQRILAGCDRLRTRIFYLVSLGRVELDVFREFWRNIGVGVNRVHGAYIHTCHAVNAVLRMNDHLVVHFVETRDRAYLHTVGEFAAVTFLGHYVGHVILAVKGCLKNCR